MLMSCALFAQSQALLPTSWNFSSPGITTPPSGWTMNQGTNGNLTYTGTQNSVGGDGISCRLDATGEFVSIWFADKPGPISYYVRGTGISPNPAFTGSFKIQESVNGTVWTDVNVFTTMPTSMTRYQHNLNSASRYARFYYTDKQSGSNVALDSVWIRQAPPSPLATINLKQGNTGLVNGGTFIVGKSAVTVFTIENKGTTDTLFIGNIVFSGDAANDFTVAAMPHYVKPNSSDTITISFNPAAQGSRIARMSIANSDSLKNPFVLNLYGIGGNYASEPTHQSPALGFSNVRSYTLNVYYTHAGVRPEKYIVLRHNGTAVADNPVDGQSYQRGDYIGASQVAYMGSDTFFRPPNIIAASNYHFAVFAFNGPPGYENYNTTNPAKGSAASSANNTGTYYQSVSPGDSGFISKLHNLINPHDTVFYSSYISRMINDFETRDTTLGRKTVSCVYTNLRYVYTEPFVWWTGSNSGTLTREHTFAQSWMPSQQGNSNWPNDAATGTKELPEYNDLHHLFPADQANGNGKRSNVPFGEVVTPTFVSPTGLGKLGLNAGAQTVWEPRNEHKGDVARALFYMCITYNGVNGKFWGLPANQDDAVLMKWHQQDPPDNWEIARNEYINSIQHNRNPFVDFPEWAALINFKTLQRIPVKLMKVLSPNGGENLNAGSTKSIQWMSANLSGKVKLEYTKDGNNFMFIDTLDIAAGLYNWTVPNDTSATVKIKITTLADTLSDMSDGFFSIVKSTGIPAILFSKPDFTVFPNPSNGTIQVETDHAGTVQLEVYDVTTRLVQSMAFGNKTQLQLPGKGLYLLRLRSAGSEVFKKVIVE